MIEQINHPLPEAGARINHGVVWLARLGFVSKGTVFIVLGLLVMERTQKLGVGATDPQGALRVISRSPLGDIALVILIIGLMGYALWELIRAFVDPEGQGRSPRGLARRIGFLFTGLVYGGLAFSALYILLGIELGSNDRRVEEWTAQILIQPFGPWMVGMAGAGVIGAGLYQYYKAYKGLFLQDLRLDEMSTRARQWATQSGRLGHAALGSVIGMVGVLLLQAAIRFDPNAAGSWREALQALAQQGSTPWLLGAVALGLVAYGLFTVILSRYANCLFVACDPPSPLSGQAERDQSPI